MNRKNLAAAFILQLAIACARSMRRGAGMFYAAALLIVASGCSPYSLHINYQPPSGNTATLEMLALQRTGTAWSVFVCRNGDWQRAAVLGYGMTRIGANAYPDGRGKLAQLSNAVKLPARVEIPVQGGHIVRIRVSRPNPPVSSMKISCSVSASFNTKAGGTYRASLEADGTSCHLKVSTVTADGSLTPVMTSPDDACYESGE